MPAIPEADMEWTGEQVIEVTPNDSTPHFKLSPPNGPDGAVQVKQDGALAGDDGLVYKDGDLSLNGVCRFAADASSGTFVETHHSLGLDRAPRIFSGVFSERGGNAYNVMLAIPKDTPDQTGGLNVVVYGHIMGSGSTGAEIESSGVTFFNLSIGAGEGTVASSDIAWTWWGNIRSGGSGPEMRMREFNDRFELQYRSAWWDRNNCTVEFMRATGAIENIFDFNAFDNEGTAGDNAVEPNYEYTFGGDVVTRGDLTVEGTFTDLSVVRRVDDGALNVLETLQPSDETAEYSEHLDLPEELRVPMEKREQVGVDRDGNPIYETKIVYRRNLSRWWATMSAGIVRLQNRFSDLVVENTDLKSRIETLEAEVVKLSGDEEEERSGE